MPRLTPIQISVFPDKLLSKHASIPFNPDVASVIFRALKDDPSASAFREMMRLRKILSSDPGRRHGRDMFGFITRNLWRAQWQTVCP